MRKIKNELTEIIFRICEDLSKLLDKLTDEKLKMETVKCLMGYIDFLINISSNDMPYNSAKELLEGCSDYVEGTKEGR